MRPLWSVQKSQHNGDFTYKSLGWKDCSVGRAYHDLFPLDIHLNRAGLKKPVCNTFQSGMMTVNFHNCYHKDKRYDSQVLHCSFSPPDHWYREDLNSRRCVFGMGSVVCDISKYPMCISFMPKHIYHCTSEPFDVPPVPGFILGSHSTNTLLGKRENVYIFLDSSIIAWGSWAWWRNNTARQHEWIQAIDGISDEQKQVVARRELIEYWAKSGHTHDSVKN